MAGMGIRVRPLRHLGDATAPDALWTPLIVTPVAVGTAIADRPPAQIRTCGITAYGSYLGWVAANRTSG